MHSRVLALKWRPNSFGQLVGQEHITRTLTNALESNRLHHAYLFCGTRGIGKTTVARVLAKCFCCDKGVSAQPCNECPTCKGIDIGNYADLIEVDAASRTKVEDTRDLLGDMQFAPTKGKYKIYLIDEVHMLSNHSFNALLKTLEEPPSHIIFLFATTEPQKIPVTVMSRCLRFNLKAISKEMIADRLREILPQEEVKFDDDSLELISYYAAGSMRDALSLTDQAIAYCNNELEATKVADMLGVSGMLPAEELLEYVAQGDLDSLLNAIKQMEEEGGDFTELWDSIMEAIQELSILTLGAADADNNELTALANKFTPEELQLYYQIALMCKKELPWASSPRQGTEMGLIRMLAMQPLANSLANKNSTPPRYVAPVSEKTETPAATNSDANKGREGREETTPEVQSPVESQPESQTTSQSPAQPEPEAPAQAEPASPAQSTEPETPVQSEPEQQEESSAESQPESQPAAEPEVTTEPEAAKPEAEAEPEAEASAEPQPAASPPMKSPPPSVPDYTQADNWAMLVDSINLEGLGISLIRDTRLVDIRGGIWILSCQSNVWERLTDEMVTSIEQAISSEIMQQISIEVEVGPAENTPSMIINKKHKELVEKVHQEPIINTIVNKYDGELNEASVRSIATDDENTP